MLFFAAALTSTEKPPPARVPTAPATAQVFRETPENGKERPVLDKREQANLEKLKKQSAREKRERDKKQAIDKADREKRAETEEARQVGADKAAAIRAAKTYNGSFYLRSYDSSAEEYSWSIFGEIVNVSGRSFSYVQVQINLLDDAGNLVGSSMANVNNLEPGQVWKFRTHETEDRATHFRIKDITGF